MRKLELLLFACFLAAVSLVGWHITRPAQAQTLVFTQAAGTITAGNSFQTAIPVGPYRKFCRIQNTSARVLNVYFGALADATAAKSFQVPASGGYLDCGQLGDYVVTQIVNVMTTTTSDTFVVAYVQ